MEQITIVIGTVTQAQRARALLGGRGIPSSLARARTGNCVYAVRLDASRAERAREILSENGIKAETV